MKKLITLVVVALAFSVVLATARGGTGPLQIRMHDPGCHSFYLGGGPSHRQYATTLTRSGPVTLVNYDEAALTYRGPGGFLKKEGVGQKITLTRKGVYHITMVKQAPDDNHLTLTVR
jgi:hypothetical protein